MESKDIAEVMTNIINALFFIAIVLTLFGAWPWQWKGNRRGD